MEKIFLDKNETSEKLYQQKIPTLMKLAQHLLSLANIFFFHEFFYETSSEKNDP